MCFDIFLVDNCQTRNKTRTPTPDRDKEHNRENPLHKWSCLLQVHQGTAVWSSKNTDHGMDRPLVPTKAIADEILRNAATLPVAPKGNAKTLKLATPAFWFFHGNA